MLTIFILGLLAHTALSLDIPCKDGEEIKAQPVGNFDYMVGNWSYIYHYTAISLGALNLKVIEHADGHFIQCPEVEIKKVSRDMLNAKKAECGEAPKKFKWEEAKLVMNAPMMQVKDSLIFVGQYGTGIMAECGKVIDIGPKKVSDSIMVATDKASSVAEMFSRQPIPYNDLKCVAKNVDVARGMSGLYMCV